MSIMVAISPSISRPGADGRRYRRHRARAFSDRLEIAFGDPGAGHRHQWPARAQPFAGHRRRRDRARAFGRRG